MATQPPLRVGLIGAGFIVERHIPAWQATPDAELVAVCDLNRERAAARAAQYGIPAVYDSVEAMLEAENLDAVDIATRPESHKALATLAAERGVHVLCQKPLAATVGEAREIAGICARAGVRFMVLEMWRHVPALKDLKRQLDAGSIGEVHMLRLLGHRRPMNRFHPVNPDQPYFAEMPKLLVYEMMIHYIDGIRFLMGDVGSVYARVMRVNPIIVGEDHALVVFGHKSGATSYVDCSWASPTDRQPKMGTGDLLIEGQDGSLHLDVYDAELRHIANDGTVTVLERYEEPRSAYQAAFNGCIADFAGSIREGRPFISPGSDNIRTLAATLAAYESIKNNTVVDPDLTP
ncbi:MAG: Gfo/Idh/MocA family oxidoreductase [Chloroflexi bacterium]|nr:Gfo/Idh/MocA family oxidoreductase [Chloroflexota bacterium]